MNKNAEYVGVDEKFIPESEKYVNTESSDTVNIGIQSINEYISNTENQEKFVKSSKKGLKVAKRFGIGYLIFLAFVIMIGIGIVIFSFTLMLKIMKNSSDINKESSTVFEKAEDANNNIEIANNNSHDINDVYTDMEILEFNTIYEYYVNASQGLFVKEMLDKVSNNNKTNSDHVIIVVYGDKMIVDAEEITSLKENFDDHTRYDLSLEYDTVGFINKIIIK